MCYLNINFLDDWVIIYLFNYWFIEEMMLEYIEGVIVLYVEVVCENLFVV